MIGKLFFTLLIIVGVLVFFRIKALDTVLPASAAKRQAQAEDNQARREGNLAARKLAYIIVGVLALATLGLFVYQYVDDNQQVLIKVTSADGRVSEYQALQKDLNGRQFVTIQGVAVTLSDTDRMELRE